MSEKSELIDKLKNNKHTREAYLRAKLNVNIPSQIRALRLRREMKQDQLAREAEMLQPRISAMERPGATKFNLETLIRLAAAFRVGLVVKFVPFSEMLRWENTFHQDTFNVVTIDEDIDFHEEEREQPSVAAAISAEQSRRLILGDNPQPQQGSISSRLGSPHERSGLEGILYQPQSREHHISHASH